MNKEKLAGLARKTLEKKLSCDDVSVYVCLIDHKIAYWYRRFSSGRIDDVEIWLPVYLQNAPEEVAENIIDCIAVKIKNGKKPEYSAAAKAWIDANRSS